MTLTDSSPIVASCLSPEGSRIVSCSDANVLRLWDAATGVEVATWVGDEGAIDREPFALSQDGSTIVWRHDSMALRVIDLRSGAELATLAGHEGTVNDWTLSPDGRTLVSASDDTTVKSWDSVTGKQLTTFKGHTKAVTACAYSLDGSRILSASEDNTVRIWNAITGNAMSAFNVVPRTQAAGTTRVCAFTCGGARIVTVTWRRGSVDAELRLWDAEDAATTCLSTDSFELFGFSATASRAVFSRTVKDIRVLDLDTGTERPLTGSVLSRATTAAISANGKWIATGHEAGSVCLWDAETGSELTHWTGHTDRVRCCSFSVDGRQVVTASGFFLAPGQVKVWEVDTTVHASSLSNRAPIHAVAFSPDGSRMAVGTDEGSIAVCDTTTGREMGSIVRHKARVTCCSFSPDGQSIVSGALNGTVKVGPALATNERTSVVYEPQRWWKQIRVRRYVWPRVLGSGVITVCAGGALLLIVKAVEYGLDRHSTNGGWAVTLSVLGALSAGVAAVLEADCAESVTACTFSSDGSRVIAASAVRGAFDRGQIRSWELPGGELLDVRFAEGSYQSACAFSSLQNQVLWSRSLGGDVESELKLLNQDGSELATVARHLLAPTMCAVSHSGLRVAAAHGGELQVWDVRTGFELAVFSHPDRRRFRACAFSPDGRYIASGTDAGWLMVWDLASRSLACEYWGDTSVDALAWHPHGRVLVSAGTGGGFHLLRFES